MIYLFYTIHVIISLFLILVVLLQQGKGADLSVFGGGSTQAAFGARGAATLLHKLTVGGFVLFVVTTLGISLMQGHQDRSSVMNAMAQEEAAVPGGEAEAPAETPAATAPEAAAGGEAGETAPAGAESETAPDSGVDEPAQGSGDGSQSGEGSR